MPPPMYVKKLNDCYQLCQDLENKVSKNLFFSRCLMAEQVVLTSMLLVYSEPGFVALKRSMLSTTPTSRRMIERLGQ